jgi:hypothetical protein
VQPVIEDEVLARHFAHELHQGRDVHVLEVHRD